MEEDLLKQIEHDWNKSMEQNNVDAMAEYMSDEWVIFSGDGNITTKEQFLQFVKSGELVHSLMDFEILSVKIYGSTGIIIQKGVSAGSWRGQEFSNHEIASTVFIKEGDQWQAVQTMLAPVV